MHQKKLWNARDFVGKKAYYAAYFKNAVTILVS
jgi:hypothetical protein